MKKTIKLGGVVIEKDKIIEIEVPIGWGRGWVKGRIEDFNDERLILDMSKEMKANVKTYAFFSIKDIKE